MIIIIIIPGHFNAKLGIQRIFKPIVGKFHDNTSKNEMKLIKFTAARIIAISNTRFKHATSIMWKSALEQLFTEIANRCQKLSIEDNVGLFRRKINMLKRRKCEEINLYVNQE